MSGMRQYYEMFAGREEVDCIPEMIQMMKDAGFESNPCKSCHNGYKAETTYYYRNDLDKVCVHLIRESFDKEILVILPKTFCEDVLRLKEKKPYPITFKDHSTSSYSPYLSNVDYLHVEVMEYYKIATSETKAQKLEVDHIARHDGVCITEWLRLCTSSQNKRNKPSYTIKKGDEFDYDPVRDFSHSFYIPFLHYVMGLISKDDMWELRRMELEMETSIAG